LITVEDILQAIDYLRNKHSGGHFNYMTALLKVPDLSEVEKYMLSADKGISFFGGYYAHPNVIRTDPNPFAKADISDLSSEFKREAFPFVLYMRNFSPKYRSVYDNSKAMVRPGGFFIVYMDEAATEQLFTDIKKDVGARFTIMYSKFDHIKKQFSVVGQKPF
jgi:hypothetical protein